LKEDFNPAGREPLQTNENSCPRPDGGFGTLSARLLFIIHTLHFVNGISVVGKRQSVKSVKYLHHRMLISCHRNCSYSCRVGEGNLAWIDVQLIALWKAKFVKSYEEFRKCESISRL